jgi:hypothetical protein
MEDLYKETRYSYCTISCENERSAELVSEFLYSETLYQETIYISAELASELCKALYRETK